MKTDKVADYYIPNSKHEKYLYSINKRKQLNKNTIKVSRGIISHSKAVQFPVAEKLANGKHRFFYKHGMLVDRLA